MFLVFIIVIISLAIWFGESRKFFCLDQGMCITVWKTYNNVCYVIPGKYYGFFKPSSLNYIKTTNLSDLDIIWPDNLSNIIANVDNETKIINQSSKVSLIINYNLDKKYNDSLFTFFDGKYHRYKKDITYISIFIRENYATDKDGRHL